MTMNRKQISLFGLITIVTMCALAVALYQRLSPATPYPIHIRASGGESTIQCAVPISTPQFELSIDSKDFNGTPPWKRQTGNPPLDANAAMIRSDAARLRFLKKYAVSKDYGWTLNDIRLVPHDVQNGYWYWLVRFEDTNSMLGRPWFINFVVLMDGTVVEPHLRIYW